MDDDANLANTHEHALLAAAGRLLGDERIDEELLTVQSDGTIVFQRCSDCDYVRFPPASICPECLSEESVWVVDSGLGAVWSFCIYHRAFDPAFKDALPYNVALIELDSGPRMISNVLGVDADDLRIGLRVKAASREVAPDRRLVYFESVEPKETE